MHVSEHGAVGAGPGAGVGIDGFCGPGVGSDGFCVSGPSVTIVGSSVDDGDGPGFEGFPVH